MIVFVLAIVGVLILRVLAKLLHFSLKVTFRLLVNGILGAGLLVLANLSLSLLGDGNTLSITPLHAVLSGILGLPYVVVLLILAVWRR